MRLTSQVSLVASGRLGFALSDDFDGNVYAIDSGDQVTLIDSGAGHRPGLLPALLERDGVALERVTRVFLTHKHADHSGGAAEIARLTGAEVLASAATIAAIGDGEAMNARLAGARSRGDYPDDYVFTPVAAARAIEPGETFALGELELTVLDTGGHCDGHLGYLLRDGERTGVFTGDALLPGGEIVLQAIPDLSLPRSFQTIRDLAALEFDALFPGHFCPALGGGYRHAAIAAAAIESGMVPLGVRVPRFAPDPRRDLADFLEEAW